MAEPKPPPKPLLVIYDPRSATEAEHADIVARLKAAAKAQSEDPSRT